MEKYDVAEDALKHALQIDSLNKDALTNLFFVGFQYQNMMLDEKALNVYNYLLTKKTDASFYYNIASVLNRQGKVDTSIVLLEKAIKLRPDYYDAYNLIASFYGKNKNDFNKAIQYLMTAYDKNPQYEQTLSNLGVIYGMKTDYKNSLIYFMKAYAMDSTNVGLCGNIGRTYDLLGNKNKANEFYFKANRLSVKK